MLAPSWARPAVIGTARARLIALIAAIVFSGSPPAASRGADPADPAAKTTGVGYRSTIAPYTRLRPVTPAPWRERNQRVTPKPQPERNTP